MSEVEVIALAWSVRGIAFHEAAHSVFHAMAGRRLREIEIQTNPLKGVSHAEEVSGIDHPDRLARMAVAGTLAQARHSAESHIGRTVILSTEARGELTNFFLKPPDHRRSRHLSCVEVGSGRPFWVEASRAYSDRDHLILKGNLSCLAAREGVDPTSEPERDRIASGLVVGAARLLNLPEVWEAVSGLALAVEAAAGNILRLAAGGDLERFVAPFQDHVPEL